MININMKLHDYIKSTDSAKKLLNKIIDGDFIWKKPLNNELTELIDNEKSITLKKIEELIYANNKKKCKLLIRGDSLIKLEEKLGGDFFNKIFIIGEKAHNYLKYNNINRDTFNTINDSSYATIQWIFEQYEDIVLANDQLKNYFSNEDNKEVFAKKLAGNNSLRDYYLFGLHTENSQRKVFFVSSTSSPKVALYNEKRKVLFLFWIPEPHIEYAQSKETLKKTSTTLQRMGLPILEDSFFPYEKEYCIKGAIFPRFIYAIIDVDNELIVINPSILNTNCDWIETGFNVSYDAFEKNINSTKYSKHVIRTGAENYFDM